MQDRNKVIEGLLCHLSRKCETDSVEHTICPYWEYADCGVRVIHDALELLKEQETIVRCKDCKYLNINRCTNDQVLCQIDDCGCQPSFYVTDDWFCAEGEGR